MTRWLRGAARWLRGAAPGALATLAVVAVIAATVRLGARQSHGTAPRPVARRAPATTTTMSSTTVPTTTTTVAPIPQASPAPTPPTPPTPAPGPATYTVQPGDTLGAIAAAHGLDGPGLCAANRLADCDHIYPGQVLTLSAAPVSGQGPSPSRPVARAGPVAQPTLAPPAPSITPDAYCSAALAYLAAHQAPNFTDICAPAAPAGSGIPGCEAYPAISCTWATGTVTPGGDATTSGRIYLDANLPVRCPGSSMAQLLPAPENEASNSLYLTGAGPGPVDRFGPVLCRQ